MTEALVLDQLQHRADRVREHSPQQVNRRIARDIDIMVQHHIREGREAILRRLAELDREWDVDRVIMANLAIAGGVTHLVSSYRAAKRSFWGESRTVWRYLLGAQLGFLLLYASVGWCPPLVVWRRLGVRTKTEIELERTLLLAALEPTWPTLDKDKEAAAPRSAQVVS